MLPGLLPRRQPAAATADGHTDVRRARPVTGRLHPSAEAVARRVGTTRGEFTEVSRFPEIGFCKNR